MNKSILKTLLLLFFGLKTFCLSSQPGAFGSDLIFSLREAKKAYVVSWYDERTKHKKTLQLENNQYTVRAIKTPVGGGVSGKIEIVYKNDTMIVYPPRFFGGDATVLDNIPFRKGIYKIPEIVYSTQRLFKPEFRKNLKPNLEGDWSEYEVGRPDPIGTVTLRRIELFKNSKSFSSLLPSFCSKTTLYSENPYYLKDRFLNETTYKAIIGNSFYIPRRFKYYFFGVMNETNCYFLQREENSPIEYGTIEVPIGNEGQESYYPHFSMYSYYQGDEPLVLGCYYDVSNTEKIMWGIFKIYIDQPDKQIMEIIKEEHRMDNLMMK